MDFSFSDEQTMLRDSVARYLEKNYDFDTRKALVASEAGWSADVWAQFAELGLLALPFSEEQGGLGGSIDDQVAFAQSFGRHLVVEPYVHAVILAGMALAEGREDEWVEKIAAGEAVAAFAYEEGNGTPSPAMIAMQSSASGDGHTLTGEKRLVVAGAQADILVVAARMGDGGPLALFAVEPGAAGLAAAPYTTIDGFAAANMRFDDVSAKLLIEDAGETLNRIIGHVIIVQSAQAVGAMEALVKISGEYAMTRKQFGQPIAGFQSIAHRLADMKIAYTRALATMLYTTALGNSGGLGARDIHVLKGQLGKTGREIGESAIQIHGGLGLTDELNVGHYHKRLLAYDAQFGDHGYHMRMLGKG